MSDALTTIIVVSYNTREMTLACLESIFQETNKTPFKVVVVDNASSDGSADAIRQQFPCVELLALEENIGFAAANNLAAEQASGDYILLLNPDTVVLNGAIDNLVRYARDAPVAEIWGGRTLFADNSLNPASCWKAPTLWGLVCVVSGLSKLGASSNWLNPDCMPEWKRDSVREVDIVSGCFFLISKGSWERLGGFDPIFHMYGEEFDLCLRAKKLGIQGKITPDAEIIHYGGASEPVQADKMCRLFATKVLLFRKHWHPLRAWGGCQLLKGWALSRLLAVICMDSPSGRRDRIETWRDIWRRRHEWLVKWDEPCQA